jgi:hypothetical protein
MIGSYRVGQERFAIRLESSSKRPNCQCHLLVFHLVLASLGMKYLLLVAGLVSLPALAAQNQVPSPNKGAIYGTAIAPDGTPAKELTMNAQPLGVVLAMALPWTKTNELGAYRFERLPLGRYTVDAEDKAAGYSNFTTSVGGPGPPPEVELTAEHPEAEFDL